MTDALDTLITPGWIIPAVPEGAVLTGQAIGIRDGRIAGLYREQEAAGLDAAERIDLPGQALLPGFINMHGHAGMSLMRGYADDLALMPWLQEHIWPAEAAHVSEAFVSDGTNLAIAEMLLGGTTCFSDMYFFPDAVARCAQQAGMRCQITFPVFDFPTAWGANADEYISKGLALRDELKHSQRISVVFGPHAPYTVNDEALAKIAMLANELDLPVHIHLHETAQEVAESVQATGLRPLQRLVELDLVGPRTQCVHMTELDEQEIALLAELGAHVIHCPASNMKLASGRCPVTDLQAAGVNVALGTDSAASNNDLSMFSEMRSAALLAKLGTGDAAALPATTALSMATINGARALGMQEDLGSLEPGKLADIIAVDLRAPELQPVHNPISQVVYAANAGHVSHCWVGGQAVMRERELLQMDIDSVLANAGQWRETLAGEQP